MAKLPTTHKVFTRAIKNEVFSHDEAKALEKALVKDIGASKDRKAALEAGLKYVEAANAFRGEDKRTPERLDQAVGRAQIAAGLAGGTPVVLPDPPAPPPAGWPPLPMTEHDKRDFLGGAAASLGGPALDKAFAKDFVKHVKELAQAKNDGDSWSSIKDWAGEIKYDEKWVELFMAAAKDCVAQGSSWKPSVEGRYIESVSGNSRIFHIEPESFNNAEPNMSIFAEPPTRYETIQSSVGSMYTGNKYNPKWSAAGLKKTQLKKVMTEVKYGSGLSASEVAAHIEFSDINKLTDAQGKHVGYEIGFGDDGGAIGGSVFLTLDGHATVAVGS